MEYPLQKVTMAIQPLPLFQLKLQINEEEDFFYLVNLLMTLFILYIVDKFFNY